MLKVKAVRWKHFMNTKSFGPNFYIVKPLLLVKVRTIEDAIRPWVIISLSFWLNRPVVSHWWSSVVKACFIVE